MTTFKPKFSVGQKVFRTYDEDREVGTVVEPRNSAGDGCVTVKFGSELYACGEHNLAATDQPDLGDVPRGGMA